MTTTSTNTNSLLGEELTSTTPTTPTIVTHFSETSSATGGTCVQCNATADKQASRHLEQTIQFEFKQVPYSLAIETVIREHYLHRKCPVSFAFGAFVDGELKGVLTVGVPASWTVRAGLVGDTYKTYKNNPDSRANDVYELNRLWMADELPPNSESTFVGWCLRQLRRHNPSIILVSYADGSMGHVGWVYQATNFFYTGTSAPFKDIHPAGYSDCRRVSMSVRGEKVGNKRAWALDPNIPRRVRSAKHRYVWFADRRDLKILAWKVQLYPKVAATHEKNTPLASGSATGSVSPVSNAMVALPDPGVESADPLVIDAVAGTGHEAPIDNTDTDGEMQSPADPADDSSCDGVTEFGKWWDGLPSVD
jgi:hypothetical protein